MTIGKAYGFFDCVLSREDIERELPNIRHIAKTPSAMNLYLMDTASVQREPKIMEFVRMSQEHGMKYTIEATYENATNRRTAQELGDILNVLFYSLDGGRELLEIVFEEEGKYILKDRE